MPHNELSIAFGGWVSRHFAPAIEGYCDILLNRINPIFEDVQGEQDRAADEFMKAAAAWYGEDGEGDAAEAAWDHAREHAEQFIEMRSVFLATGVSGLFHLFEKQLYLHINKELKGWLVSPVAHWRDLETIATRFDRRWGQDAPCHDFATAFADPDLQELRLVANAVKHGDDGPAYRKLLQTRAPVVDQQRLEDDWTVGPYSVLGVKVSVQAVDVERYRAAVLRFWELDGTFCASLDA